MSSEKIRVSESPVIRQRTGGPHQDRNRDIHEFTRKWLDGPNVDLFEQMMLTLCRLAGDESSRGGVKMLAKSLAEMRHSIRVFERYRSAPKVSIFGSARTPEDDPDYLEAEKFARLMTTHGWMVITGAGDGIMKAGHGGAGREKSFGVAIRLPLEQQTNAIIADDPKLVNYKYFFTRKVAFVREAAAVALFPGGFGTQDECFEVLTLIQTGKTAPVPLVMVERKGGSYWPHWQNYIEKELLSKNLISPEDFSLYRIVDRAEDAVEEILRFYKVYHSLRYVRDRLVIRSRTYRSE
jgi:hypothetical protein